MVIQFELDNNKSFHVKTLALVQKVVETDILITLKYQLDSFFTETILKIKNQSIFFSYCVKLIHLSIYFETKI